MILLLALKLNTAYIYHPKYNYQSENLKSPSKVVLEKFLKQLAHILIYIN